MAKFSIGEIAIIGYAAPGKKFLEGKEVEIVALPGANKEYPEPYTIDISAYVPRASTTSGGMGTGLIYEEHLRKKRPPKDEGAREWFEKTIDTTKQPVSV